MVIRDKVDPDMPDIDMSAGTITIGGQPGCRPGGLRRDATRRQPGVGLKYPDRDGAVTLLRAAVDAGVTFIDTADVYGPHTNEILIRRCALPYPDNLVIATKGGFVRGGLTTPPLTVSAIRITCGNAHTRVLAA